MFPILMLGLILFAASMFFPNSSMAPYLAVMGITWVLLAVVGALVSLVLGVPL